MNKIVVSFILGWFISPAFYPPQKQMETRKKFTHWIGKALNMLLKIVYIKIPIIALTYIGFYLTKTYWIYIIFGGVTVFIIWKLAPILSHIKGHIGYDNGDGLELLWMKMLKRFAFGIVGLFVVWFLLYGPIKDAELTVNQLYFYSSFAGGIVVQELLDI